MQTGFAKRHAVLKMRRLKPCDTTRHPRARALTITRRAQRGLTAKGAS